MRKHTSFTKKEVNALLANPYVAAVSPCFVKYTVAFKEIFWNLYTKERMSPTDIMTRLGFDISLLGNDRINAIPHCLKGQYEKYGSFHEGRHKKPVTSQYSQKEEKHDSKPNALSSVNVERLQHEVEYMKQEIEFIKKTILADRKVLQK